MTTVDVRHVELSNEVQALRWQVSKMDVANATLAAENRRLRRMTSNGKAGRILHRAAADARQIVGWRSAGYSVTRRQCASYGMSARRWMWSTALLRLAGVLAMGSRYSDDFLLDDLATIESAIGRAVTRVEKNGLSLLVFRMAKGTVKG